MATSERASARAWRLALPAALALAGGCWFELADVVVPDEGCTGGAPQRCGTRCLAEGEACEPVDVSGEYVVQVVNDANTCRPDDEGWEEGATTSLRITVTQEGDAVSVQLNDLAGLYFVLAFGAESATFTGTVDGDVVDAAFVGANARTQLFCTWTMRVELDGVARDDLITGTLTYLRPTNGHPSCATIGIEGCATVQRFNATRPP